MVVILIIILLYYLPVSIFAQSVSATLTPVADKSSFTDSLKNFLDSISRGLISQNVTKELGDFNYSSIPPRVTIIPVSATISGTLQFQSQGQFLPQANSAPDVSEIGKAVGGYNLGSSVKTPVNKNTSDANLSNSLKNIFGGILDAIGFVEQGGGEIATKFAGTYLPANSKLKSDVKGTELITSLGTAQCANLPVNTQCLAQNTLGKVDDITPYVTPTISIQVSSYPTPATFGDCAPIPDGFTGSKYYYDYSTGNCAIMLVGYCSEGCMTQYFGEKTKAQKASQICQRESGGNPFAKNKSCLYGSSVDFSIGLFQINLLAHCAHEFIEWGWIPPHCTLNSRFIVGTDDKGMPMTACEQDYYNVDKNINKAFALSYSGTYWRPWSVSKPAYCNIN